MLPPVFHSSCLPAFLLLLLLSFSLRIRLALHSDGSISSIFLSLFYNSILKKWNCHFFHITQIQLLKLQEKNDLGRWLYLLMEYKSMYIQKYFSILSMEKREASSLESLFPKCWSHYLIRKLDNSPPQGVLNPPLGYLQGPSNPTLVLLGILLFRRPRRPLPNKGQREMLPCFWESRQSVKDRQDVHHLQTQIWC